jgi:CheY-like chemotaxis protein
MPHVLLVEDELQLRRILTLNLARGGCSVAEADSVETAFDMVMAAREAGIPFDLIVLETHLPDRCGWDLLRMLRATSSASERPATPTPVVVISPLPVTSGRLAEFAPVAALLKPFPIEALLRMVARAQGQAPVSA